MTRGERIKAARDAAELTQFEVAVATGIDTTYYSKIENDRIPNPGIEIIEKIARALNVTPNDLLGFTNSEVA